MNTYRVFSQSPAAATHEFDPNWYRPVPPPVTAALEVEMPFYGNINGQLTNIFQIAYTVWGDRGPWVLLLHGVPTNKSQYYTLQKRLAPFCRTISIDMLGMGESSKPQTYGSQISSDDKYQWVYQKLSEGNQPYDWVFDTIYIEQIRTLVMNNEQFFFIADDWGGGILSHYASMFPRHTLGNIWINPIAFDGYPVAEIQAFGRASQLNDQDFQQAMGAADQTMVQILKSMVHDPSKWNQYNLRDIKRPYVDVDYESPGANSITLQLDMIALRSLCDRAAILAPELLLPYDPVENRKGVDYNSIVSPCKIIWGQQDNMMPERQAWRFLYALSNAEVSIQSIDRAGHLSMIDQPDRVAEAVMSFFLLKPEWRAAFADVCLGFDKDAIYKGDEEKVIAQLRTMLNTRIM